MIARAVAIQIQINGGRSIRKKESEKGTQVRQLQEHKICKNQSGSSLEFGSYTKESKGDQHEDQQIRSDWAKDSTGKSDHSIIISEEYFPKLKALTTLYSSLYCIG